MDQKDLSRKQLDVLAIIERTCSVFSLLGCILIIATFCTSKVFHKPINRLVFYASFGNAMTNVATLMARSYVGAPNSAGCQVQAFLIQMFMPADAFWTLAMAVNVYLTFYYKFDGQKLRKMEIPYLIACYGVPFIVALTYLFINDPVRGRMYGNATLWCWVASTWDVWRIATFYGPVWVVIIITFFIYIRAGREIYKKHKQLKQFSSHHEPELPPPSESGFGSSKTTEVFVTSEAAAVPHIDLAVLGRKDVEAAASPRAPNAAYSVHISSSRNREGSEEFVLPIQSNMVAPPIPPSTPGPRAQAHRQKRKAAHEANSAAWSYTKCAILFFAAMLVTWVPSSANRFYSIIHQNQTSSPLEYMSAFVLPLQGFWNAIIYLATSWHAAKLYWAEMFHSGPAARRPRDGGAGYGGAGEFRKMSTATHRAKSEKSYESESMTELADSRPSSHERRR